ncbi:hypothetical protein RHSIM_Rhsim01G0164200 [Rhododendron simsii]|uniref:Peptidase A2 domain-containing protein n=1 Tax=Rhododendron simsii TaxID=118357 RepID=A0A834LWB1_RHOSS|nr:hypothetical protein RHSIM_Rhsim01G0164200 [Rhododendron simsii]
MFGHRKKFPGGYQYLTFLNTDTVDQCFNLLFPYCYCNIFDGNNDNNSANTNGGNDANGINIVNPDQRIPESGQPTGPEIESIDLVQQFARVLNDPESELAKTLMAMSKAAMARNQPTVEVPVNVNVNPGQTSGYANRSTEVPPVQVFDNPTFETFLSGMNRIPNNVSNGQNQSFYQSIPTTVPMGTEIGNNGNNAHGGQNVNANIFRNDNRNIPNMANGDPNLYGYDPPNIRRQDYPYGYDIRPEIPFPPNQTGYEAILMEGEYRKSKSLGTYYQDIEGDVEIDVAQVIGKAPIVCDTLTKAEKPVNMPSSHPNRRNQANFRQYSFDLSKADQLFDELINQKFLTLSPGHIIPPEKDRKGKDYCKWHNSFRHNTNNCVTFRNCVKDLIQKGLLQYAKGNKEVMGIDIDPFPLAEVNMVTARLKKGKMASQIERRIQEEEEIMEREEEVQVRQKFENYFCLRCDKEIKSGEEIIAEKEYNGTYAKALPGKPDTSLIYPPLFMNERGRGFYPRGTRTRGRLPFVRGGYQGRMVIPPNIEYHGWDTVRHPKFPNVREFVPITNTQKRRLQRKISERERRDQQMMMDSTQWLEIKAKIVPNQAAPMVWTRESTVPGSAVPKQKSKGIEKPEGQTSKPTLTQRLGVQNSSSSGTPTLSIKEQKAEFKKCLKKKMEEFQQVLLEDDEDDDLLSVNSSDMMKEGFKDDKNEVDSQKSTTFGQALDTIQFGSVSPTRIHCNMILVLPKTFQVKPNQPISLEGDVEDQTDAIVKINEQEEDLKQKSIQIEKEIKGKDVVVWRTPENALVRHLKPLYIMIHINGQPINKVLIDNGAIVNILPSKMMKILNKNESDLIPTEVTVGNFAGGCSPTKGVISLQLQIGNRKMNTTFFVIDSSSNYNALLGKDWIHINGCVPSSLHQALIFLKQGDDKEVGGMEIFWVDKHPFKANTNNVEASLYDEDLWPIKFEGSEVKSVGVSLTESQFLKYLTDGFKEISRDFVRPNMILRRLEADEPISYNWADCVVDDSPLTLKELAMEDLKAAPAKLDDYRAEVKDPLEDFNVGTEENPKILHVCAALSDEMKDRLKYLLSEFKNCFAWDYPDMPGLNRSLVEHKIPIKEDFVPYQQISRQMTPEVQREVKKEMDYLRPNLLGMLNMLNGFQILFL